MRMILPDNEFTICERKAPTSSSGRMMPSATPCCAYVPLAGPPESVNEKLAASPHEANNVPSGENTREPGPCDKSRIGKPELRLSPTNTIRLLGSTLRKPSDARAV